MVFSNKVYDTLKWIALVLLPPLAALYLALAKYWNLPYPEAVSGTIMAIDTFLGAILQVSTKNYKGDGEMIVNETDPEKDVYTLQLNGAIEDLSGKETVTFKVKRES